MPFNGSGSFSPFTPGNPVVSGAVISATDHNNTITDIASGLSNAVTRDGQSPPTSNLPMASFKFTGLAAGTTAGDSVRYEQVGALALSQGILHGRCQLTKSGANLILLPKDGNTIQVNGAICTIPDAGVTLAAPATTNTTYLIYAIATAGVITSMEASTTAHATSTTAGNKGVEIKSADDTRTLVGIARTVSSAWVDTITQRFVRSYFNRQAQNVLNAFTATRSTTSLTAVEINAEIQNQFVCWADDAVTSSIQGSSVNTTANIPVGTAIGWDGTVDANTYTARSSATGLVGSCSTTGFKTFTEGYHYTTLMGVVASASTGTWQTALAGVYTTLSTQIK